MNKEIPHSKGPKRWRPKFPWSKCLKKCNLNMIFFFLNEYANYLIFTHKGVVKPAFREFVMERPLKESMLCLPSPVEKKKKTRKEFIELHH